jgi:hypothetical protein
MPNIHLIFEERDTERVLEPLVGHLHCHCAYVVGRLAPPNAERHCSGRQQRFSLDEDRHPVK